MLVYIYRSCNYNSAWSFYYRFILEKLKFSSRSIILIALLLNTSGLLVLGDWQSIGGDDVCQNYSIADEIEVNQCLTEKSCIEVDMSLCPLVSNTKGVFIDIYYETVKTGTVSSNRNCFECSDESVCAKLQLNGNTLCLTDETMSVKTGEVIVFQNTSQFSNQSICIGIYKHAELDMNNICYYNGLLQSITEGVDDLLRGWNSENQQKCESNELCYWNPDSIITGEYCYECPPLCRNKKKSLNFAQVCIALTFIALSIEFARYNLLPLTTKVVTPPIKVCTTAYFYKHLSISLFYSSQLFSLL